MFAERFALAVSVAAIFALGMPGFAVARGEPPVPGGAATASPEPGTPDTLASPSSRATPVPPIDAELQISTETPETPLPMPPGAVPPVGSGAAWSASDLAALRRDLDAALEGAPAIRGAHVGVFAIDTASGAVLYRSHANDEFQPASTTKLVVGSAALDRLGPAYQWKTRLEAAQSPGAAPSLLLRGGGDPLLDASDLAAAARAAVRDGVRTVASVSIDDSRYTPPRYPDGWVWDDFGQDYAARPAATTVEENVVHLHVRPGDDAGTPAAVSAEDGVTVDDEPGDDCIDAFTSTELVVHANVTTGAANAARDIDVALDRGGCPSVFGTMPLGGAMHSIDVAVESPAIYTRTVLLHALAGAGIAGPNIEPATAPARYGERAIRASHGAYPLALWEHDSAPLQAVLGPDLWIPSDNFVAEMLLDELGYATGGAPGTTDKGLLYEKHWLQSIGIDLDTVTLADGSGLSQYDRLTPVDLVAILQHDWNGPHRDVVLRSLPIGGVRGTIESLTAAPLASRVFAKTGNMSHVHGLAGYLSTQHHGPVTFAFLVDDCNPPYAEVSALRARVLSRIVTAP